ncbi:MAG: hypothetical protein VB131_04960 [Burkholderia gladioli]
MSIEMQRVNGVKHWGEAIAMVAFCIGAALLLHYLVVQYPKEKRERLWQKNGLNACSRAAHHTADRIAGATGKKLEVFLVAINMTDDDGSYSCKADVRYTVDGREESEIWAMEGSRKTPPALASALECTSNGGRLGEAAVGTQMKGEQSTYPPIRAYCVMR